LADAQHLPQGRRQAGDRHLNFHETRDNLSVEAEIREAQRRIDAAIGPLAALPLSDRSGAEKMRRRLAEDDLKEPL